MAKSINIYHYAAVIILILLILAFTACKKNSPVPNKTKIDTTKTDTTKKDTSKTDTTKKGNAEPGLYVVGTSGNNAVYWINGRLVNLGPGGANAIAISNGYVYIAGYSLNATGYPVATYWKNGVAVKLADSLSDSYVFAICVVGNDVYATGTIHTSSSPKSIYWKNGVASQIPSQNSIAISNSNVYIAGASSIRIGNTSYSIPAYYTNGIVTSLDYDNLVSGEATTIEVDGTDIYVGGIISDNHGHDIAVSWKNGVLTFLKDTLNFSFLYASAIQNHNALYAGFTTVRNSNQVAVYWKNNTEVLLADTSVYSQADAMTTYGDDIYIAGSYDGGPVYWKNGAMTKLSGGGFIGGIAYLPQN